MFRRANIRFFVKKRMTTADFARLSHAAIAAVFVWIAFAQVATAATPAPDSNADASPDFTETVGSLPYSNQWVEEKTGSYLYLAYSSSQLAGAVQTFGEFSSDFNSSGFAFPSVDFFSKFLNFGNIESQSILKDFSLWGRYSLGVAVLNSQVTDSLNPTAVSASATLFLIAARVGASLEYDRVSWIKPYLGFELDPYIYRNTSSTSETTGVERNGVALGLGPVLGAHFPLTFIPTFSGGNLSLLGEVRRTFAISMGDQILGSSFDLTGGLGLTF
jgi:hypothetical protein